MDTILERFGWKPCFQASFRELCGGQLEPARVIEEQKQGYALWTARGTPRAELSGRLRHEARTHDLLPAVGDWVGAYVLPDERRATIHRVLPRDTVLARNVPGRRAAAQVIAANVDKVMVVISLEGEVSPRLIERLLAQVWESGAQPVVILSKADLCAPDRAERLRDETGNIAHGVPVFCISSHSGQGLLDILPLLEPRKTVAVVGKSGAGKSTLVNFMAGEEIQLVHAVRDADGRGRHTTTNRQLRELPGGALLIDTPGIREFALWDAADGVEHVFGEIEEFAAQCRFRDCAHRQEPGCAIRAAIDDGSLDPDRWEAYGKLKREIAHEKLKENAAARQAARLEGKRLTKTYRDRVRDQP